MTFGNDATLTSWPAGHRAALTILTLLDDITPPRDTDCKVGVDYGPTGLNRLLNLFADAGVTATIGFSADSADVAPTLVKQAATLDFEVAGWQKEAANPHASPLTSVLSRIAGSQPGGRIVGLPPAPVTGSPDDDGWIVTGAGGDLPLAFEGGWLIPTSPYWMDETWLHPAHPTPPSSLLEAWSLSLSAVRTGGSLMTLVLNAHISGRPGIAGQILRFLDEVIESGDVWIANAGQVANWWKQQAS